MAPATAAHNGLLSVAPVLPLLQCLYCMTEQRAACNKSLPASEDEEEDEKKMEAREAVIRMFRLRDRNRRQPTQLADET